MSSRLPAAALCALFLSSASLAAAEYRHLDANPGPDCFFDSLGHLTDNGYRFTAKRQGGGKSGGAWFETRTSRQGGRCLAIQVDPSTNPDDRDRFQYLIDDYQTKEDVFIGFSLYIPDECEPLKQRVGIFERKFDGPGYPPGRINLYPGFKLAATIKYGRSGDEGDHTTVEYFKQLERNRWYDLVLRTKYDETGKDGHYQLWVDGVLLADYHGKIGYTDQVNVAKQNTKFGPYNGAADFRRVFFFDEVRAGNSYVEVDPARGAGPGGGTPTNQKPAVSAGPDRTVTLPGTAALDGTVTDDGLPAGSLTSTWSTVSGPGSVTFASASAVDTTASFPAAGTYVLRLTASDGSLAASDDMQVVVQDGSGGGTPGGDAVIAEAETALRSGGAVVAQHLGFTGTGYVDYDANPGSYIEWLSPAPAGRYLIDLRYACRDAAGRPLRISVDGVTVADLAMVDTAGWANWQYSPAVEVELGATSRIRATALTLGPNVDHLRLTPVTASEPPPTEPPAEPGTSLAVAAVIASADDGNVAANTIDGDLATRWSASGDGQWIRYDLGTTCEVGAVAIAVHRGDARRAILDLQVSADGAAWTTVWSGRSSGTTTALEAIAIPPSATRFVRILGHGNTANLWNSFTEVEIHGVPLPGGAG